MVNFPQWNKSSEVGANEDNYAVQQFFLLDFFMRTEAGGKWKYLPCITNIFDNV